MKVPVLVARFLESEAVNDRSPNTISQHYYTLKNFYKFVSWRAGKCGKGCKRMEEITDYDFRAVDESMILGCRKQDVEEYRAYMRQKADMSDGNPDAPTINKKTTARVKLVCIKDFYRFLHENEYLDRNVMEYVQTAGPDAGVSTRSAISLSLEEVTALLRSVKEEFYHRDLAILVTFLTTGMRLNELVNLNVNDVDLSAKRVHIRKGKGAKQRDVPLSEQCAAQLQRYLDEREKQVTKENIPENPDGSNPLFLSKKNRRISRRRVENIVEVAIRSAGLAGKNYSTHKLRHTAATLMYNNGADMNLLKEILGHANIQVTTIYAHPDDEAKRAAIDYSPIAKIDLESLSASNGEPVGNKEGDS